MADDKSKQLNETLSQIEKQFGKGTVMTVSYTHLTLPTNREV